MLAYLSFESATVILRKKEKKRLTAVSTVTTEGIANGQLLPQGLKYQEQKLVKGQGPAQGRFRGHVAGAENMLHAVLEHVTFQLQDNLSLTIQPCHVNMPDAKVSSTMPLSASSLCASLNYVFSII